MSRETRACAHSVRLVAAIALFQYASPAAAADEGLFDEPAIEAVLYESYRFPTYDSPDVATQRNDNNRSGASHARGINQHSIRGFHRIGEIAVDPEAVVTAQPLYASSATVRGIRQGVVIVATSNNKVIAVQAAAPFTPLWGPTDLGAPASTAHSPAADCDLAANAAWSETRPADAPGFVGVEASPVLDLPGNRVLVGYKTADFEQHLAALDLNDGHVIKSVRIAPPGHLPQWARLHRNRASLLLADGVVYLAFSSLCEGSPQLMHGSIVAFDARTLDRVGDYQVTDSRTDGGGIWQGASGPAADTEGNIYFVTGNRRLPAPCLVGVQDGVAPESASLSNSVVRLHVEKRSRAGNPARAGEPYSLQMSLQGFFTPYRRLLGDCWDLDLGSAGPLLIPESPFLVAGGKEGTLYVLDRADPGGFDKAGAPWNFAGVGQMVMTSRHGAVPDDANRDHVHQKLLAGENTYDSDYFVSQLMKWPHIHGTPVFARFDARRAFLFVWPEKDALKRYQWDGVRLDPRATRGREFAPPNLDDRRNGMPGGMLSVNIDPSGPSLGVVLAAVKICDSLEHPGRGFSNRGYPSCADSQDRGILRAYDPFTLQQVWSNEGESYWFSKFVPPTVAAGSIFLATASGKVLVYGR